MKAVATLIAIALTVGTAAAATQSRAQAMDPAAFLDQRAGTFSIMCFDARGGTTVGEVFSPRLSVLANGSVVIMGVAAPRRGENARPKEDGVSPRKMFLLGADTNCRLEEIP